MTVSSARVDPAPNEYLKKSTGKMREALNDLSPNTHSTPDHWQRIGKKLTYLSVVQ